MHWTELNSYCLNPCFNMIDYQTIKQIIIYLFVCLFTYLFIYLLLYICCSLINKHDNQKQSMVNINRTCSIWSDLNKYTHTHTYTHTYTCTLYPYNTNINLIVVVSIVSIIHNFLVKFCFVTNFVFLCLNYFNSFLIYSILLLLASNNDVYSLID